MILHRFMSAAECAALIKGDLLTNITEHAERGQRTTSVGFCFFPEDPDEAIHWLSGCTFPDYCVTLDIPDYMLQESEGIYRDPKRDDLSKPLGRNRPTMTKKEYCLQRYSLRGHQIRLLNVTDKYYGYAILRRGLGI